MTDPRAAAPPAFAPVPAAATASVATPDIVCEVTASRAAPGAPETANPADLGCGTPIPEPAEAMSEPGGHVTTTTSGVPGGCPLPVVTAKEVGFTLNFVIVPLWVECVTVILYAP